MSIYAHNTLQGESVKLSISSLGRSHHLFNCLLLCTLKIIAISFPHRIFFPSIYCLQPIIFWCSYKPFASSGSSDFLLPAQTEEMNINHFSDYLQEIKAWDSSQLWPRGKNSIAVLFIRTAKNTFHVLSCYFLSIVAFFLLWTLPSLD